MSRLSKFEVIGLGLSVLVMAVALYLLRIETSVLSSVGGQTQTASVAEVIRVEGDSSNPEAARERALYEAVDARGSVETMVIEDVRVGTGREVVSGDTVTVHYTGRLQTGEEFDSSRSRGEPFSFTIGQGRVIPGWEQGLIGMQVGGERILVIPPDLAYGNRAIGPIPPNSTLLFSVELLSVGE
jgi:FKBP-type peptidyl-prolyl cis-trans isomerase